MGIYIEGVHTKGRQRVVMKQRVEGGVGREVGQNFQVDGLEARGRSTKLLEEEFSTRELNQYGGCHRTPVIKGTALSVGLFCKQYHRVRVLQPHRQHPTILQKEQEGVEG